METLIEHTVEPEVAMPAPRRTHLPLRMRLLLMVAVLLLGMFIAGSGRALWEAAKLSWLAGAGHTTVGHVVQILTEPAAEKEQPPHQVSVRYACDFPGPNGILHREGWIGLGLSPVPAGASSLAAPSTVTGQSTRKSAAAAPSEPPFFRLGQSLPIRYAPWFGGVASHPWQSGFGGRILTLLVIGALVMLVSLLLLRRLLRWSQERLHLVQQGTATVGTITHKRTEAEDMVRYFLSYGYASGQTEDGTEGQEHEEQVSMDQWKQFHVGQPVTVLYDPDQPERVGLYALIRH